MTWTGMEWERVYRSFRGPALGCVLLLAALCFLFLGGCGGKKKIPASATLPAGAPADPSGLVPDSAAPDASDPALAAAAAEPARIRILLRDHFISHEIEGDDRASRLRVEAREGQVRLYAAKPDGVEFLSQGSGFRFSSSHGSVLKLDGREYRGLVDAFINPLGVAVIVNDLPIEEYLRSVVPNELGPYSFPVAEALKAQAVAARTFAVAGLGTWARHGFDLFADLRSQEYTGVGDEHALTDQAVRETEGIVATYGGEPILALYSSTCGGVTESFESLFKGGPIPYLKGGIECDDRESPYHHWTERVRIADIQDRLHRYLDFGSLRELVPLNYSPAGRVVRMRFVAEREEKVLRGNDIRFALGLRSNYIEEMESELDDQGLIESMRVSGRGWGHGVGLCQLGAVQLGRKGRPYDAILRHYYRGIELRKWY